MTSKSSVGTGQKMSQGSFKVGSGGSKKCGKRTEMEEYEEECEEECEEEGELMLAAAPIKFHNETPLSPWHAGPANSLSCSHRPPKDAAIPTYEETMYCALAEGPPQFPMQPEEDLQCHAPGGARLGSTSLSAPPSYESIILAQGPVSGSSAASSRPG